MADYEDISRRLRYLSDFLCESTTIYVYHENQSLADLKHLRFKVYATVTFSDSLHSGKKERSEVSHQFLHEKHI